MEQEEQEAEAQSVALEEALAFLLEQAKASGVYAAEAAGGQTRSMHCQTRKGVREEVGWSEETSFSLRLLAEVKGAEVPDETNKATTALGEAIATCSLPLTLPKSTQESRLRELVERASACAKLAPPDPWLGLASGQELMKRNGEAQNKSTESALELEDTDASPSTADLIEECGALEAAGMAVAGVEAVESASAYSGRSVSLMLASNGVERRHRRSFCGRSIALIAGTGSAMEVDWEGHSALWRADLESCEELGARAGRRVTRKLDPESPKESAGAVAAVFEPRVAKTFLRALVAAANGEAIARGTSFMVGYEDKTILPKELSIMDEPLRPRGHSTRTEDAEGLKCEAIALYKDGFFKNPLLDLAHARRFGKHPTANAYGAGSAKSCGASNVCLRGGVHTQAALFAAAEAYAKETGGTAFFVTDLMGRGLNSITGDWSQGFQGFVIEGGECVQAVSGATLAGNVRDLLPQLLAGDDLVLRTGADSPSLMIPNLSLGVAGS